MQGQMRAREERGGGNPSTNRPEFSVPHKTFAFYKHSGSNVDSAFSSEAHPSFTEFA